MESAVTEHPHTSASIESVSSTHLNDVNKQSPEEDVPSVKSEPLSLTSEDPIETDQIVKQPEMSEEDLALSASTIVDDNEKIASFIPNEVLRWVRLRDQMLLQSNLQKYAKRVIGGDLSSWSSDEAFASYLLDCLEDDLAHGDKVIPEGDEDMMAYSLEVQLMFPLYEGARWERLRDRMLSLPYFDRYVHEKPELTQDELFGCCLLDRLEEQIENSRNLDNRKDSIEEEDIFEDEEGEGEDGEAEAEDDETEEEGEEDDSDDSDYVPGPDSPGPPTRASGRRSGIANVEKQRKSSSSDSNEEREENGKKPKKKVFQCKTCNMLFESPGQISQHFVIQHHKNEENIETSATGQKKKSSPPTMKVAEVATPLWYCKDCDTHVEDLKTHRLEKHSTCDVCGKKFFKPQLLRRHMERRHKMTESDRKNLLCHYCGKRYSCPAFFRNHIKVHRGENVRTNECNICGKSFAGADKLIMHKRIHFDEKPFECSYCGRRFTQKYNMTKHTRIHTGDKPYACDLCNESFNHNVSLKNHKKKVHGIDWWNKGNLQVVPLPTSTRQSKRK